MGRHKLYSFSSSSSGNCNLLVCGETKILIDFGISVLRLRRNLQELSMDISDLSAILLTHEHIDHVKGIKTFVKKHNIPIYATRGTAEAIYSTIPEARGHVFEYFGDEMLQIDDITVETFLTPHDAEESVGFIFKTSGLHFGYATDLGFVPRAVEKKLNGCVTALLESNHDVYMLQTGPYPYYLKQRVRGARGHLSNDDCACLAANLAKNGTRRFLLAHLSETNNDPYLARRTCLEAVHSENPECEIFVLPADGNLKPYDLE